MSVDYSDPQPYASFKLVKKSAIQSLNVELFEYQHVKTGAQHIHLAADNSENVFLVGFRTVPEDSTGVAHILEHTVLCGSERYPVRDPFFMMTRRSLNTFMNAFTSSDWTAYPFASKNPKDFQNLLEVYLDAVFFSRLHELDFKQEGHRLELSEAENLDSPLEFKGVVFNEMKGAMSSPVSTLWQTLTSYLFPTNTYHYNSGGDPEAIPNLSYEQLLGFYQSHYHPSNAIFCTFGNIPAQQHQAAFETLALHRFEKSPKRWQVVDERRFNAPVRVEEHYPVTAEDGLSQKTHLVMGWLLEPSIDIDAQMQAHLLSNVLLENSASPLRHALETSDLGLAPSPLCGLEESIKEMLFVCGIEGSEPDKVEAFEELVLSVLKQVAEQGVPQDQLESVLHQLELSQREIGGDSYPYGLQLILSALPFAIHRGEITDGLAIDAALERLREQCQDPNFIKQLVREQLLENTHRVTLSLKPDSQFQQRQKQNEEQRLKRIKSSLSNADLLLIREEAQRLKERQAQMDDENILPKVGIEDVPQTLDIAQGTEKNLQGLKTAVYGQGTNGLVYQQLVLPMPELNASQTLHLPLFGNFLTELGWQDKDYLAVQQRQSQISGGISAFTSMRSAIDDEQRLQAHFVLSSKALWRNYGAMNELMHDTFKGVSFKEHNRIRELIAQTKARRLQSVTGSGHSYAMGAAISGMSPQAQYAYLTSGLAGLKHLKALDQQLGEAAGLQALLEDFSAIHEKLMAQPRKFLLIAEPDKLPELEQAFPSIWLGNEVTDQAAFQLAPIRQTVKQAWLTNTQVNFCAKAYPTVTVEHPDAAPLTLLGVFLTNGFLHRSIREQGGAYGGGASQDSGSAALRFYSYRDPRLTETLADFDEALHWLINETHPQEKLDEAILGIISSMDKPGSPAGEAKQAYHNELYGRTREQRQRFRARLLSTELADLKRVAETYLRPELASTAVVTHQDNRAQCESLGLEIHEL